MNIDYPNITGASGQDQIQQIKSYLFRLSEQLNYELQHLNDTADYAVKTLRETTEGASKKKDEETPIAVFNAIKSLIINSAEIVKVYEDEITKHLEGLYVARSDFGEYQQKTDADLSANSTGLAAAFRNIQTISSDLLGVADLADSTMTVTVNGTIKAGLIEESPIPVYGIEVGQTNTVNGQKVFDKFARFTAEELAFYDGANGVKVAYISGYKMKITNASISGNLDLGKYTVDTSDGLAFLWKGADQ